MLPFPDSPDPRNKAKNKELYIECRKKKLSLKGQREGTLADKVQEKTTDTRTCPTSLSVSDEQL